MIKYQCCLNGFGFLSKKPNYAIVDGKFTQNRKDAKLYTSKNTAARALGYKSPDSEMLTFHEVFIEDIKYSDTDYDYESVSELDWADYQIATIEYDYRIHPKAAESIRSIFKQLSKGNENGQI